MRTPFLTLPARATLPRLARPAAALTSLALMGTLAGCAQGAVQVEEAPQLDDLGDAAATCEALLDALPATVDGEDEREVEPAGVAARAWGEPAIVVVCGAEMPAEFTETSDCEVVADVQWYATPDTYRDQSVDAVLTTVGFDPIVQLRIPAERRPPVEEMSDVASAILENATLVDACA